MILPQTIDQIFNTARVEEVIADFVNLKRSGSNLRGLSPFSEERTPSFMVSPTKQIWKDFSSGKGGNVVSFLMEHEHFSYPEALRWLAKKYNVEIEEDQAQDTAYEAEKAYKQSLFQITDFALHFFQYQLHQTEEGKVIGKSYLKERGFSDEVMEQFKLGYSPKQRDAFALYAQKNGYQEKEIVGSGIALKRDNNSTYVDRFRERVIFPIFSFSGRPIGFGARILNQEIKTAKYLNSPESEIYHKSKALYGFYQAKNEIRKRDQCILVEGYTDVLSFYQSGIKNVVASSGTALTPDQIRLVKRITDNILLIYDGDSAGIKASFRGIDLLLEQNINVEILQLPIGEDPDSFARKKEQEVLEDYIKENATDFIRYKANILAKEAGDSPTQKAKMVGELINTVAIIENPVQKDLYVREIAKTLQIEEKVLFGALAQKLASANRENQSKKQRSDQNKALGVVKKEDKSTLLSNVWLRMEHEIIQVLLNYGDQQVETEEGEAETISIGEMVIQQFQIDEIQFRNPFYKKMLEEFTKQLRSNAYKSGGFFTQLMDEDISNAVADMTLEKYTLSNWEEKGIFITPKEKKTSQLAMDLVYSYKLSTTKEMIDELAKTINEENREESIEKIIKLNELKNLFDIKLGRSI